MIVHTLLLVIAQMGFVCGSQDVVGYWENWLDVVWWGKFRLLIDTCFLIFSPWIFYP